MTYAGVCGGANLYPSYMRSFTRPRFMNGESAERKRLQDVVLRIGRGVYTAGGNYLCGLKCALSLAGLCSDVMAEPFQLLARR